MWLLEAGTMARIEQAYSAGVTPNTDQEVKHAEAYAAANADGPRILSKAGNNAQVSVRGVLTQAPSFMAMLFGGGNTTYPEIIASIASAEADPEIETITLDVDSPGGQWAGVFDAVAALQNAAKPIKARVSGMSASAAYLLTSQADEVSASNPGVLVGSIGVVQGFRVDPEVVEITSTNAPNKRPDVTTAKGVEAVREELDPMHELFVESIASARGVTVEKVNAEFGKGGVVLAGEAQKRGMIDSVVGAPALRVVEPAATTATAERGGEEPEKTSMDLATLKAQHPELFAQVVQMGVDKERDRVIGHLTMGEGSGAMPTAVKAVKEGAEMTNTLQAEYLTAGMNRRDLQSMGQDNPDTGSPAALTDEEKDKQASAAILKSAAAVAGVELEA